MVCNILNIAIALLAAVLPVMFRILDVETRDQDWACATGKR